MNIPTIIKLRGMIDLFLEHASRINEQQARRYWYPLSQATYGPEEIIQALDSMCSFRTSMWEKTLEFESKFSAYQGSVTATMVNSGSSADLLAMMLLIDPRHPTLRPGDEVLAPAVTWPTQLWSVLMAGLKVRLVDVDPHTLNIDLADARRKITERTRVIFVVHLMGNPCDMHEVHALAREHGLIVVEDCCEALGSEFDGTKVGNFGICGAFSFFFAHHMCTMEGGMLVTAEEQTRDRLRVLRAHGWTRNLDAAASHLQGYDVDPRYAFVNWGLNVRPTEVQAGFGIEQLTRLPQFNRRREELAGQFFTALRRWPELRAPVVCARAKPCWFALPLMVHTDAPFTRTQLTQWLEEAGVETRPIVAGNLARHPVSKVFPHVFTGDFPGADQVHHRGFYVGLSPITTDSDMARLIETFDRFIQSRRG